MWKTLKAWLLKLLTSDTNVTPPEEKGKESPDLFMPSERRIYQYWDGEAVVSKDPMELWKALMEVGPELNVDIKLSRSPSKDAMKGYQGATNKIRKVFSLKPYSEGGLMEAECLLLLDHFLTFAGVVKKNTVTSPTSQEETSSPTPEPTTEGPAVNPPMSATSDSGSTEDGSGTGRAIP